ncbi:hypothetical protein [Albidovulum sediminis]|uniref:Uncharacterized protein n=1 Tax=Albidovulum sediminis TaxID=3066345 RepID=A0ABT2NG97_9RHOB|nr:hypothetical protein [Defluviimonas sediminis]MCT8327938.1 hypothetical protein [Defluviimonas sediminis]
MTVEKNESNVRMVSHLVLVPLYLPALTSLISFLLFGGLWWPVSDSVRARRIVPKLITEHAEISSYFTEHAADTYSVTYVNYLCLAISSSVLILMYFFRRMFAQRILHDNNADRDYPSVRLKENPIRRTFVLVVATSLVAILVFFVPLAFSPSAGISELRSLLGLYFLSSFLCSLLAVMILSTLIYSFHLALPLAE